jgi:uncharacterized protein involved in type VI secretion and phage assembly
MVETSLERNVATLMQKMERLFHGKYRGLVVDNEDPENLGRLKAKVPSVLGTEIVTGWAMPCVPLGGAANQGVLFVPEVGAGVWVEFEEGDLEFPVWVGTYWSKPNGESELPKPNDPGGAEHDAVQSPPTRKIIKTMKGHTIQFEDADGDEMVILVDGVNGHVLVMDKDGIKISDGVNGHEFVLDGDGVSITDGVTSGNLLKMASGAVTLESAGDVLIKGVNVTIEASGKLEAKGNPIHLNP